MLGFSLLATILIYRRLAGNTADLTQAGQFAISMAIVRMLNNSVGSAADLVVLRRVPILFHADPIAAAAVIRIALLLRLGALLALVALGLLLHRTAQESLGASISLLLLIAVAASGELLLRAALSCFQALEQFGWFVTFEGLFQIGRLVAVLALLLTGTLDVYSVLTTYAGMGFGAALFAAAKLPRNLFKASCLQPDLLRDTARYFGWTLVSMILSAVMERIDLFMLGRFSGVEEAGLYGGILTLALIPDFLLGMLVTVLQPRVIKLHQSGQLRTFNRKIISFSAPAGLLAFLAIWTVSDVAVPFALGPNFSAVVPAFVILASGSLLWLAFTPVSAVLIRLSAPRLGTALTGLQLTILVVGGLFFIPAYGAVGAAALVTGSRFILAIAIMTAGQFLMRGPLPIDRLSTGSRQIR
jgi:O-antigen/teichoic acid export membrane protein